MEKKTINEHLEKADSGIIGFASKYAFKASQIGLSIIFFWFGILKLLGVSPAESLIVDLTTAISPSLECGAFVIALGVLEILIALTILDRDLLRLSLLFLVVHLVLVILPLFFLPEITWQATLVPTLEGQYILKNILIAVVAMGILADLDHLQDHIVPTR